jgi:opacity protein-like surface antigen
LLSLGFWFVTANSHFSPMKTALLFSAFIFAYSSFIGLAFAEYQGEPMAPQYGYGSTYGSAASYQPSIAQPGWTMGLEAGRLFMDDVTESFQTSLGTVDARLSFDKGWGVVVPVTYQFSDGLTLGFSAGYQKAHFGQLTGTLAGLTSSTDIDGKLSMVPVMANAGYNIPLSSSLTWNFGGGAGAVRTDAHLEGLSDSDVSWDLGFQAFTGLNLTVAPQTILNLGYRYTLVKETDLDTSGHLIEAGVTFRF